MSIRRKMDLLPTKGDGLGDTDQQGSMIVKNRLTDKRNQVSKDGQSRNNEDVNPSPVEVVERQATIVVHSQRQQWPQPQPQAPLGPIVCWENFLPVRSLNVLLVENDDSTRHVVSALLRNCSYQVRAVSNGLEAWIILQDLTNNVDLVLTEVAMPGLSGIDLLSKIMSHKTCKNIPVIMMSSNDSMGVVFKCLSNGAVDFLVKPIRKNELKNLWQHVWRKCHSSSGCGSESGIRTAKSTKSKSVDGSDNNSDSNDVEDSENTGLMYNNGSDNDSGIQSSCSKRALEVPSHPISQSDDLADPPGSTCALVIRSRVEAQSSNWVPTSVTKRFQEEDDEPDNVAMGKDLTIGAPTSSDMQLRKHTDKVAGEVSSTGTCGLLDIDVKKYEKKQGKDAEEHNIDKAKDKMQHKNKDVINATADVSIPCRKSALNEVINDLPKVTKVKNVDPCDEKEPSLELSVQRLRDVGNSGSNAQGHNILKHSDHSAFSRYNTSSTTNQAVTVNLGSCSPLNYSLEAPKTESMHHLQGHSTGTPNRGSNGSSNSIDIGSTTNNVSTKTKFSNDEPIPRSAVSVHHSYAYEPVHYGHCPAPQTIMPSATKMDETQEMDMHQHTQVEHHHHHHYHHHHHHVHSSQQQQKLPLNSNDSSSRNLVAATSNCVPSDKLRMAIEGNIANYASASESNNGNSGHNRKGTAGIAEGTNVISDNGSLGACATGSGSRSGLDQVRLTLREAALNKFCQKRKQRCFEKKVRYESRKKLAEQRPRVRGQFVRRQATDGKKNRDESNDTNS